ncbi:hypothetical protein INT44_008105, partial [Umbelopsis vinacea]
MPGKVSLMRSLQDYDISPETGFLPPEPPLRRLLDPYFDPWESTMDDFNGLLLAGRLRERVRKLPILNHKQLKSKPEYRRAFLVLCMLSHGYVWGKHEEVSESLPPCLAIPWTHIASHLGVCPVVCHASVVLWNYKPLWEDGPLDLSNLAALTTYSGSVDEAWFYLVTVAIESAGAPAIASIIKALDHVQANDEKALIADLTHINACLADMNVALARMSEKCDPYVFYWKIRPYLAGWENMADAGLPLGLIYEGVDNIWDAESDEYADMSHLSEAERMLQQYRKYAGGSAAQSSLIHALDVAFGVEHHPTGERKARRPSNAQRLDRYNNMPPTNPAVELTGKRHSDAPASMERIPSQEEMKPNRNNFIQTMRKYMPREHRHFLADLEKAANLRPYMLNLQAMEEMLTDQQKSLLEAYNGCLDQLKAFRDKHVQIVSLYIVNQARKGPNIPHGGFAMDHTKATTKSTEKAPDTDSSEGDDAPSKPNILYPQTALSTSPSLSKSSSLHKLNSLLPTLGLAKFVDPESKVVRGTGGTNVMPFLKQSRDETADTKIALSQPVDIQAPEEKPESQKISWTDWLR